MNIYIYFFFIYTSNIYIYINNKYIHIWKTPVFIYLSGGRKCGGCGLCGGRVLQGLFWVTRWSLKCFLHKFASAGQPAPSSDGQTSITTPWGHTDNRISACNHVRSVAPTNRYGAGKGRITKNIQLCSANWNTRTGPPRK